MATAVIAPATDKPAATMPDLKVYAHSDLIYWWPVWAVGFLMALLTLIDGHYLAVVPDGTVVEGNRLVAPEGAALEGPAVRVTSSRLPGVIFLMTFLAVLLLTHVYFRGPWALFLASTLVAGALFVNVVEGWHTLYHWFSLLRVHVNLGGYLLVAVPLFLAWALAVFLLDRRTYMIFSVGQVRIRDELGAQEKAFDTTLLSFEKKSYDWFRWLVGGGAGDLVVRVGGPQGQVFELNNVVRVGKWLHELEGRLRKRNVV